MRDITELLEFELVSQDLELWSESRAYSASIVLLFQLISPLSTWKLTFLSDTSVKDNTALKYPYRLVFDLEREKSVCSFLTKYYFSELWSPCEKV